MPEFSKFLRPVGAGKYKFFIFIPVLVLFWVAMEKGHDLYRAAGIDRELARLYPLITQACLSSVAETFGTVPERLRHCVHINTIEKINDEFYRDWKDDAAMAQGLLDYIEGRRKERKPFECSTRSGLLIGLLRFNGYQARDVITAEFKPGFDDHVIVEVWNEDLEDWEATGVSYDVFFRDDTGNKLSVLEMVTLGVDKFQPCLQNGKCGWDLETADGTRMSNLKSYWGNMVVKDHADEWQVIYNPDHFDPQKPLGGQAYCQKREKFCRIPPLRVGELKVQAKRLSNRE